MDQFLENPYEKNNETQGNVSINISYIVYIPLNYTTSYLGP